MRFTSLLLLPFMAVLALAQRTRLTESASEHCTGMYAKRDWGGPADAAIKIDLKSFQDADPDTDKAALSLIIFEYQDYDGLGVYVKDLESYRYVCTSELVDAGLCKKEKLNQFIYNSSYSGYADIKEVVLTGKGDNDFSYPIKKTGYYCVAAYNPKFSDTTNKFDLVVNFQNSFGSLPASEVPLLPLYGLLAVVYAVCLLIYLFQIYKHRQELLLLQKYLAGFFVFLTAETIITWSLYDLENNSTKYPMAAGIKVYIVFVSLLNAFKTAFSLFLLLIIALGYGVVYPKLSRKTMNGCKLLSLVLFAFLAVYITLDYYSSESQPGESTTDTSFSTDTYSSDSWIIMIVGLPVACLFVAFYFLILNSMSKTVKTLKEQNQAVKLNMYKKLFRLIFLSMLLMIFAFVISTILLFNDNVAQSIEKLWKFDAVLTNFWPACLYFLVFIGIVIIWRPTDNSYLLAVSDQLPDSEAAAGADNDNDDDDANPFGNNNVDNAFEFDDLRSLETNGDGADGNPFKDPASSASAPPKPPTKQPAQPSADVDYDLELEQQKRKESQARADKFSVDEEDPFDDLPKTPSKPGKKDD